MAEAPHLESIHQHLQSDSPGTPPTRIQQFYSKNKLSDLHQDLYSDVEPRITLVTETWLNDSVTNSMLDPVKTIIFSDATDLIGLAVGSVLFFLEPLNVIFILFHKSKMNFYSIVDVMRCLSFYDKLLVKPPTSARMMRCSTEACCIQAA